MRRESTVFLSGIGCAARFPYYMNTYGLHSIHGRAPAIATGLATTRPDLDVWVVTGDGDALSIGGNHLIHALRRNVNLTILMFNNQIYGLTKGQYSPTSEVGKVTKSTPFGSLDTPVQPDQPGARRRGDLRRPHPRHGPPHMQETFRRAHEHKGAAFVEVYQNCNVFNDGAFEKITGRDVRASMLIPLAHGEPIRFGADLERGVVQRSDGRLEIVDVAEVGEDALLVHDEAREDPGLAFALSRLAAGPTSPRRSASSGPSSGPSTATEMSRQIVRAQEQRRALRRPRGAAARPGSDLDGRLSRSEPQSSSDRKTMPVRGFGLK